MKIFLLFALSSLTAISTADQQKLRGNNSRKLEDAIPLKGYDGFFNALPTDEEAKNDIPPIGNDIIGKHDDFWPSNLVFDSNTLPRESIADIDVDGDTGKDETDEESSPSHEAPPNEGKDDPMSDVRQIAKMAGLSLEDTKLLLLQQQDFSELATRLQENEAFLQTEMPSEPNGEFVIRLKGGDKGEDVPSDVKDAIRKFALNHAEAQIKVVPSRLSLLDAEERAERLVKRLEELHYGQVSYTIDGDSVDIEAKKPANDASRDMGKIPRGRTAKILGLKVEDDDLLDAVLVLVDFNDEDIAEPLHTYGGRQIFGGGSQCTNAFSVISSNGVMGTATAGHCDGMTTYNAVAPEADYALGAENQHEGYWGDLQWHTTSHMEPAEYYSWPTTRWPVRSIANSISKGEWVCSYSRMKGDRRCDQVFRTSVSVNYSCCPRMRRLVAMEGNFNIPGDSGGPWSYYDKAYGIVSGWKTICNWWIFGCNRRDLWSRVSYLGPSLGVQVRTM